MIRWFVKLSGAKVLQVKDRDFDWHDIPTEVEIPLRTPISLAPEIRAQVSSVAGCEHPWSWVSIRTLSGGRAVVYCNKCETAK